MMLNYLIVLLMLAVFSSACSPKHESVIPAPLLSQIDWTVSFEEIKTSPSSHQGTLIITGGEVLSAKRLKDQTKLTVLQLPLSHDEKPTTDRTQSQGRFIAFQSEFLDPATIPTGTRVTIVGEVSGSTIELLDEMEYTYPTLTIKHLEIWPDPMNPPYWNRPFYGHPYSPYGFGSVYQGGFGWY